MRVHSIFLHLMRSLSECPVWSTLRVRPSHRVFYPWGVKQIGGILHIGMQCVPHVAPTPEQASATAEPKHKAKPASLLRPQPPELPEDCLPEHAPEGEEAKPAEPVPEDNSMPEPACQGTVGSAHGRRARRAARQRRAAWAPLA